MDPLSDILSLLKPHTFASGGFPIGADRSISIGTFTGIKCYALVAGEAWLDVDGVAEPTRISGGDCFLLPRGRPFRLAQDLSRPPIDALAYRDLLLAAPPGETECFLVGGFFGLTGEHAETMLAMLPPIVHLHSESDKAALRWSIERMRQELRDPQPGGELITQHIAHMMLVQALRLHLAEGLHGGVGWLFALADAQMRVAIGAMHDAPGARWTVQDLADRAGLSRSSFAQRFKDTVGEAPMEYLTRWRMAIASDRLATSTQPISTIAIDLGYESEAAFSTAFRRLMGCSPRRYGRQSPASAPASPVRAAV